MARLPVLLTTALAAVTLAACGSSGSSNGPRGYGGATPSDADAKAVAVAFGHANSAAKTCALLSRGFKQFLSGASGTCEQGATKQLGPFSDVAVEVVGTHTDRGQKVVVTRGGGHQVQLYVVEEGGRAVINSIGSYRPVLGG